MTLPNHNKLNKPCRYEYDLDRYTCVICGKTISSRTLAYNADNCSGADLSDYTNGLTQVPQPATSLAQGCQYQNNTTGFYQPPASYASSTASVPCPEGIEREDPNLPLTNTYLPLGPDTGLNEIQHRRTASVHSDMSYQMRRFLIDQQANMPHHDISPPTQDNFLPQDIWIQSQSSKKKKEKRRSKPSYQSFQSSSSEEYGFVVGADATAHIGEWIGEDGNRYERDGFGYPLSISGMTDELNGE